MSPQKAAKKAERAAQEAELGRRAKRRTWLTVGGIALATIALMVADGFWLRHQAKQRHEQRYHRSGKTNAPASAVPLAGQSQATNHE